MGKDAAVAAAVPSTLDRLAEQFPTAAHKKVRKGGRDQTYNAWTEKVKRLNTVLGADWSFRIIREGLTETEAWALGEITATIDGVVTVRQHYGCEPIAKGQGATPTGDLFKIAGTDAFAKAVTLLGVGLYLSVAEERAEVEAAMQQAVADAIRERELADRARREANRPKPSQPTGKAAAAAVVTGADPTPLQTKAELAARLKKGIEVARSLGLDPEDVDPAPLNRAQIEETIESLLKQCVAARAEARKQQAAS